MNQCFIVSPPRAGSTLLQRLLSAHPAIKTVGEPWLALPFVYALRDVGVRAEYSHRSMSAGIAEFVNTLPGGSATWLREAGAMLARLEGQVAGPQTAWFLDKTPRYFLILDELAQMFPNGRFCVLNRNPLAVVASILTTWHEGRFRFGSNEVDIYESPRRIAAFLQAGHSNVCEVRYEDLVSDPKSHLQKITDFLQLSPIENVTLPEDDPLKRAKLGDKTGIHRFSGVSSASVDAWKRSFASPLRKAWARRYLQWLGSDVIARLGYNLEQLLAEVDGAPISLPQTMRDLVDFNTRALPLLFAPRLDFVAQRRRDARMVFRWQPGF